MGRPRTGRWAWLPQYCYADRGRIVYKQGRMTPVRLCSESEATYALVVQRLSEHLGGGGEDTLKWLCQKYLESPQFQSLAVATRRAYGIHHKSLINFAGRGGRLFGDAEFRRITPGLLRKYLDRRAEQGAPVAGNREVKGFLSAVFAWAGERDMLPPNFGNPCHGVTRNSESARTRYVEDWEMSFARQRATPPYLGLFLDLAYLLAARSSEVLRLQRGDLTPDGVRVRRLKGSRTNVVEWSPALESAVNAALGLPGRVSSLYLLHDDAGQPITYSALRGSWDRLMARCAADAERDGVVWSPWTRHDLKRKAVSDHSTGAVGGHKTSQMRDRYRVREDIESPVR